MSDTNTGRPEQQFGYHGEEKAPAAEAAAAMPPHKANDGAANRGTPAPQSGSGGVTGSGASAGGGGGAEDYDSDTAGGGGAMPQHPAATPDRDGDGAKHGSR